MQGVLILIKEFWQVDRLFPNNPETKANHKDSCWSALLTSKGMDCFWAFTSSCPQPCCQPTGQTRGSCSVVNDLSQYITLPFYKEPKSHRVTKPHDNGPGENCSFFKVGISDFCHLSQQIKLWYHSTHRPGVISYEPIVPMVMATEKVHNPRPSEFPLVWVRRTKVWGYRFVQNQPQAWKNKATAADNTQQLPLCAKTHAGEIWWSCTGRGVSAAELISSWGVKTTNVSYVPSSYQSPRFQEKVHPWQEYYHQFSHHS